LNDFEEFSYLSSSIRPPLSLEITDAAANLADDLDISQSDAV
jgi:hypothetical protein